MKGILPVKIVSHIFPKVLSGDEWRKEAEVVPVNPGSFEKNDHNNSNAPISSVPVS